ncbi:polysaccharide lyase family 7 protein [Vibrio gangliei]|uniref:polysaccharide lyase family 7 protein n=1 Tax=Vibrio gangliei TaxID=2077090 RepID=UPI001300A91B|nr:polysaccharide lyase family 7 protein [Vibrio gangliei]
MNKLTAGRLLCAGLLLGLSACSNTSASLPLAMQIPGENKAIPDEFEQFKPIFSQAKLQISDPNGKPGNITNAAKPNQYAGVMNEHFYVDKSDSSLVFSMYGVRKRAELRFMDNFTTETPTLYHLRATVKPINPQDSVAQSDYKQDEITYMQVHSSEVLSDGKSQFPHPLLRIVWKKERWGIKNHYWATVKSNTLICKGVDATPSDPNCDSKKAYSFYDLGPWDEGKSSQFEIIVGQQTLVVKRNDVVKLKKDISYWDGQSSYFKAGVYNQFTHGTSLAKFKDLRYWVENK